MDLEKHPNATDSPAPWNQIGEPDPELQVTDEERIQLRATLIANSAFADNREDLP